MNREPDNLSSYKKIKQESRYFKEETKTVNSVGLIIIFSVLLF